MGTQLGARHERRTPKIVGRVASGEWREKSDQWPVNAKSKTSRLTPIAGGHWPVNAKSKTSHLTPQ